MKKGIRKVIVSVLLAAMLIGGGQGLFATAFFVENVAVAEEEGIITPFADVLQWRYKAIDGKLYRRLYNRTTNQWMTEWEYCP